MRRFSLYFTAALALSTLSAALQAQTCNHGCPQNCPQGCHRNCHLPPPCCMPLENSTRNVAPLTPEPDFLAFTGKVIKNKVRLRHQPHLESPILKEMNHGDLLMVVGETDDFYAVHPPAGTKAYVFRTYVLDNVVEANKVNVRLEPDVESPVIAQLSAGDRIEGAISPNNNKWIEIAPPPTTRFFISKDYIEKLGDSSLMTKIEKRREEANHILNSTQMASQNEMQKPFPDINLEQVVANYNKIVNHYQEFPEQVAKAKQQLEGLEDHYMQKKIIFLEQRAKTAQDEWQTKNSQLNDQMKMQQQRLAQLEQQIKRERAAKEEFSMAQSGKTAPQSDRGINSKMAAWMPIEEALYHNWSAQNSNRSMEEFYGDQRQQPILVTGFIEPYTRVIKNKPGDYLLINHTNNLPIAFLYSTHVNLQDHLGKEVTLQVSQRPNNHFAYPAFFVLRVE